MAHMRFPRNYSRLAALLALLSVLFTQLALAVYVCPGLLDGGPSQTMTMPMPGDASLAAEDKGCTEMDKESPNLCLQYSQAGSQSFDRGTPYVPLMLVVLCFSFFYLRSLTPTLSVRSVPDFLKRDTAPPLSIQHCCFRI